MLFLQTDSIKPQATEEQLTPVQQIRPVKTRHPYQVLRMLPADATPAQQDSAIQAVFQPEEIHYSDRPDTLHLPGQDAGKSIRDVSLPKYYKETFFSNDSLLHPELNGGRYGVAGDPVPYTIHGDNIITSLLLACFILALVAYAQARRFILMQAKNFFYPPRNESSNMQETGNEVKFQLFLVLQTCLLLSLIFFFYTQEFISTTFVLTSQYQLIGITFALFLGYFIIKALLYHAVNWVFFDKKQNARWFTTELFIVSVEGVLLFPLVMLLAYFNLSVNGAITYTLIVVILVKLLTFYKCYVIFFRRIDTFLQIILYFCALEVIPLLDHCGVFW
jgi:hypothetical protein